MHRGRHKEVRSRVICGGMRGIMGFIKKNGQKKEEADTTENKEYQFPEEAALKECRHCRMMIPKTAKICPNCKKRLKRNTAVLGLLICLIAVCGAGVYYYLKVYVPEHTAVVEVMAESAEETEVAENRTNGETASNAGEGQKEAGSSPKTEKADEAGGKDTAETEPAEEAGKADSGSGGTEGGNVEDGQGSVESGSAGEGREGAGSVNAENGREGAGNGSAEDSREGAESERAGEESTEEGWEEAARNVEGGDETVAENDGGMAEEAMSTAGADTEIVVLSASELSDYTEEEFREICRRIDYKKLLRSQETYLNGAVMEELTVIEQVDGGLFDENIYYLCKREDGQGITRYYIVRDDRTEDDTPILAGDVIQVYGQLFGSCKLPGYLVKTQPVVPALTIVYFDLLAE